MELPRNRPMELPRNRPMEIPMCDVTVHGNVTVPTAMICLTHGIATTVQGNTTGCHGIAMTHRGNAMIAHCNGMATHGGSWHYYGTMKVHDHIMAFHVFSWQCHANTTKMPNHVYLIFDRIGAMVDAVASAMASAGPCHGVLPWRFAMVMPWHAMQNSNNVDPCTGRDSPKTRTLFRYRARLFC